MQRPPENTTGTSRDKMFWFVASSLLVGQLAAFWMVCSHQVHMAEVRHASAQLERMTTQTAAYDQQGSIGQAQEPSSTRIPVNHVYH